MALPEFDKERLCTAWQEAVFALYLAEGKIEPEVVENMRTWPHSGFHVDQSVHLAAGDKAGIERLMQYMTRCPFSLSRLVKVTKTGRDCLQGREGRLPGLSRSAERFVGDGREAELPGARAAGLYRRVHAAHSRPRAAHLVRYYGWYSNKSRGSAKAAASAALVSPRLPGEGSGVRA